jgi:4-hydroxy-2-oxoheptanedioate aldolase
MGLETVESELYALEAAGATPVVRLPHASDEEILRALEIGTRAVMMSHVSTAEDAARVVAACQYPPQGTRGLSPFTRIHGYSDAGLPAKLAAANDEMFVGVLVEGEEGLANLDAIAATPGLDMVYLGVYDLSMAAGVPGELDHPKVIETMRDSVGRIEAQGLVAGSVARDREYLGLLWEAGFRFLSYRNDAALLRDALATAEGWYRELAHG